MTIRVFVDSTADIPADLMKKYDIQMISLKVNVEGKEYLDKIEIEASELHRMMEEDDVDVKTSQASPMEYKDRFEECAKAGEDCIFVSLTHTASGNFSTSSMVARELKEEYPDFKIEVINSLSSGPATGMVAVQVAKQIEAGKSFEEVVEAANYCAEHTETLIVLEELKWLIKGGRMSKTAGLLGTVMNIKPVIDLVDGAITPIQKVRGTNKAIKNMVELVEERIGDKKDQKVMLAYGSNKESMEKTKALLENKVGLTNVEPIFIGAALSVHMGPRGLGVIFLNKDAEGML